MSGRIIMDKVKPEYVAPSGPLWDIAKTIPDMAKWHHYFEIYEELFAELRDRPIKMLEIGVYKGGSLEMWSRYLHPDSTVVGIDINHLCERFDNPDQGRHVRIGSQTDHTFLIDLINEFGPFDVILDDGSHMTGDQTASFVLLFKNGLKDDGLYIVEDTHTNFWKRYHNSSATFIYSVMQLVELMHSQYYLKTDVGDFDEKKESSYDVEMEYYEAWIRSVRFFDSIVAIEKRLKSPQVTPFSTLVDDE